MDFDIADCISEIAPKYRQPANRRNERLHTRVCYRHGPRGIGRALAQTNAVSESRCVCGRSTGHAALSELRASRLSVRSPGRRFALIAEMSLTIKARARQVNSISMLLYVAA